jgi:hypothetical protein
MMFDAFMQAKVVAALFVVAHKHAKTKDRMNYRCQGTHDDRRWGKNMRCGVEEEEEG